MKQDRSRRFRMTFPLAGALRLFAFICATHVHAMTPDGAHWAMSLGKTDYVLQAQGSVLDGEGARVELASSPGRTSPTGGTIASVDATAYRGHTVKLSGLISTTDARDGAGIWLRADGPHGRLAFANSQASLVKGTASAQGREVEVAVPPSATFIVFGTLLFGDGYTAVDHLSLVRGDAVPAASIVLAQAELDAAIDIVKRHALHASSIDWPTLEAKLRAEIGKDDWAIDAYPSIRELLKALQDHHSHLLSVEDLKRTQSPQTIPLPTVVLQQGGVGYIALPGFSSRKPEQLAAYLGSVSTGVARIAGSASTGWVLDLRKDEGGNMWPMLAVLRPFLGNGPLGYFKDASGLSEPWQSQLNELNPGTAVVALGDAPLAVLTGPHTASAGEAVVIALKGRPHTRFFGQPTFGVPTGNRKFALPDGADIALTTTVELDRNKVQYDGRIPPDELVAPDASPGPDTDATLAAAQRWLRDGAR